MMMTISTMRKGDCRLYFNDQIIIIRRILSKNNTLFGLLFNSRERFVNNFELNKYTDGQTNKQTIDTVICS